jgi:hypothetical protein
VGREKGRDIGLKELIELGNSLHTGDRRDSKIKYN